MRTRTSAADAYKWQDRSCSCSASFDRFLVRPLPPVPVFHYAGSRLHSSFPPHPPSSINGASPNFAIIAAAAAQASRPRGVWEGKATATSGVGLGARSASTWGTSPCTATAGQPVPGHQAPAPAAAETTCTTTTSSVCTAPAWPAAGAP